MYKIVGVDESGKGPVIGPLVIVGVATTHLEIIEKLNVCDSKKLTPRRREYLAMEIKKILEYRVEIISAEQLNEYMKKNTLNELEVEYFAKVINDFSLPVIAYVDSPDVNPTRFEKNIISRLKYDSQIISKHYADKIYPIVSSASILAKVIRDNEMRKIENELNCEIGSGYPSDRKTIAFINNWVKNYNVFPPHIRIFWKTCDRFIYQKL